jgi:hypothetical protein
MPITSTNPFKGRHFPGEVILPCVRWYLRYPLASQHVAELLLEPPHLVLPGDSWGTHLKNQRNSCCCLLHQEEVGQQLAVTVTLLLHGSRRELDVPTNGCGQRKLDAPDLSRAESAGFGLYRINGCRQIRKHVITRGIRCTLDPNAGALIDELDLHTRNDCC